MTISKPCQYAIQAMVFLAKRKNTQLVSIREISKGSSAPLPFLAKIISILSRRGLVEARRGKGGGVRLVYDGDEVTVGAVVEAIDGSISTTSCVLGTHECDARRPCPLHKAWVALQEERRAVLNSCTLSDLARARSSKKKRR